MLSFIPVDYFTKPPSQHTNILVSNRPQYPSVHSSRSSQLYATPQFPDSSTSGSDRRLQSLPGLRSIYQRSFNDPRAEWIWSLFSLPFSETLDRIRLQYTVNTIVSILVVCAYEMDYLIVPFGGVSNVNGLLGGFLSFLLVFRTDSSYTRLREARMALSDMQHHVRCLCREARLRGSTKIQSDTRRLLLAFIAAFEMNLTSEWLPYEEVQPNFCALNSTICPIEMGEFVKLLTNSELESIQNCVSIPVELLALLDDIQASEERENMNAFLSSSSNKGYFGSANQRVRLRGLDIDRWSNSVHGLSQVVSSCERIASMPVPRSYNRLTNRFLTLWTLVLPFSLVHDLRYATVLVELFTSWALLSIESLSRLLEDPFRTYVRYDGKEVTQVAIKEICSQLASEVKFRLPDTPASLPTNGVFSESKW